MKRVEDIIRILCVILFTIAGILFLLWIFLQLHEIEYENLNLGVNICNFVAGLCVTLLIVSVAMVAIIKMKKLNEKSLLPLVVLIAAFLLISLCYFVKSEDYRLRKIVFHSKDISAEYEQTEKLPAARTEEPEKYTSIIEYEKAALSGGFDVSSIEVVEESDSKYLSLNISNVEDYDKLMLHASFLGMALNPIIQANQFVPNAEMVEIIFINIDEDQAIITLAPPLSNDMAFTSNIVVKSSYANAQECNEAYDALLGDYDLMKNF